MTVLPRREFNEIVNMTASELEDWLGSEDSTGAGWSKDDGSGETIGYVTSRADLKREKKQRKETKKQMKLTLYILPIQTRIRAQDHRHPGKEPQEGSHQVRPGRHRSHAQGGCVLQAAPGAGREGEAGHGQQELQELEELGARRAEGVGCGGSLSR